MIGTFHKVEMQAAENEPNISIIYWFSDNFHDRLISSFIFLKSLYCYKRYLVHFQLLAFQLCANHRAFGSFSNKSFNEKVIPILAISKLPKMFVWQKSLALSCMCQKLFETRRLSDVAKVHIANMFCITTCDLCELSKRHSALEDELVWN